MKTQAEVVAREMLDSKTCLNCHFSMTRFVKREPVLKCHFTGEVVSSNMHGCYLWEHERED